MVRLCSHKKCTPLFLINNKLSLYVLGGFFLAKWQSTLLILIIHLNVLLALSFFLFLFGLNSSVLHLSTKNVGRLKYKGTSNFLLWYHLNALFCYNRQFLLKSDNSAIRQLMLCVCCNNKEIGKFVLGSCFNRHICSWIVLRNIIIIVDNSNKWKRSLRFI